MFYKNVLLLRVITSLGFALQRCRYFRSLFVGGEQKSPISCPEIGPLMDIQTIFPPMFKKGLEGYYTWPRISTVIKASYDKFVNMFLFLSFFSFSERVLLCKGEFYVFTFKLKSKERPGWFCPGPFF